MKSVFFSVPPTSVVVDEEDEGTNVGLIVGLIIAGIIILAVIAALLFYCLYWKNRDPNAGKPIVENTKPRFEGKYDFYLSTNGISMQ